MAMDFPSSPAVGQLFTVGVTSWRWDGTTWNIVPQMGPMSMSDVPPSNPAVGQLWWRTTNGQMYVWYHDGNSGQWVQAAGAPSPPGAWEKIDFQILANQTSYLCKDLAAFDMVKITASFDPVSVTSIATMQLSSDNGASFIGTNNYWSQNVYGQGATAGAGGAANTAIPITVSNNVAVGGGGNTAEITLCRFNKPVYTRGVMNNGMQNSSSVLLAAQSFVGLGLFAAMNALQIGAGSPINGSVLVEGVRG